MQQGTHSGTSSVLQVFCYGVALLTALAGLASRWYATPVGEVHLPSALIFSGLCGHMGYRASLTILENRHRWQRLLLGAILGGAGSALVISMVGATIPQLLIGAAIFALIGADASTAPPRQLLKSILLITSWGAVTFGLLTLFLRIALNLILAIPLSIFLGALWLAYFGAWLGLEPFKSIQARDRSRWHSKR